MSWNSRLTLLLVATVALAGSLIAPAAAETQQSVDVIVVLDDAANPSEVAREHRVTPRHLYDVALTGFSASVPEGRLVGLRNDPRVAYISDDGTVREAEQTVPTGVSRIDAPKVHAGATGSGIRTAIIDTGIDSNHPDLQANLDSGSGYDCVNKDADPEDDRGHGTHVAGTVAAVNNTEGVIGTAPAAQLVAFKVLDSTGSGSWSNVICGLDKAAALNSDDDQANNIDIANMSLSGSGSVNGSCNTSTTSALYQAVCGAIGKGIAITVAAGNNSADAANYIPGAYPEVITVSAYRDTNGDDTDAGCTTTCDEEFASFSNFGDIVDVIAPGAGIYSTTYDGRYGSKSGTSMAAPHVAGVAALVLQHTAFTPAQLEAHLRSTGQCPDDSQNQGTGNCTGQGEWDRDDGDSVTEPMVNAFWAAGATVENPDGVTLSATGYKVKGVQHADLTWSGATSTSVDVHRDDRVVATTANPGVYTDNIGNKGGGSYIYRVCEAGTSTCSNYVTVTY